MQELTLAINIAACVLAVVIYRRKMIWKYFALMLFFTNFVSAIFYFFIFFVPGFSGHPYSQMRSLLQVLGWFMFSLSLARRED